MKQRVNEDGAIEYLVRWVEYYTSAQDTWEPMSAVENAQQRVRACKRLPKEVVRRGRLGRNTRQRKACEEVTQGAIFGIRG